MLAEALRVQLIICSGDGVWAVSGVAESLHTCTRVQVCRDSAVGGSEV